MDSSTASKVMDVLSNPEMLEKITAIASGLNKPQATEGSAAPASKTAAALAPTNNGQVLLSALKPFLRQERRDKIDGLMKIMGIMSVLGGVKTRGGD